VTDARRLSDETTFSVPEHVLARRTGDELVVLNLDSEQYYGLDEEGTWFWEQIASGASFGEAVNSMQAEFEVDRDTLIEDLTSITADLQRHGLVVIG
jgi:hypothetical protein